MKYTFSTLVVALFLSTMAVAQTVDQALKDLIEGRFVKATNDLESIVAKSPNNAEAIYWLGQIYLAESNNPTMGSPKALKAKARDLYTKGMAATNQAPLLMVAIGHVELLEGKNAEARAHFDAAIAATANKKNKKYGDPAILNAIVRANSDGGSKIGDIEYALQKATQSEEIGGATPDLFTCVGVIYLKGGAENGGPAKRSFEKALTADPNYAPAYYRIGRIFETQRNPEMFLSFYEKAIAANPKFAPAYLSMYNYYANRDVNKAKEYLDFYIANADKNRETDYFYADYLFRSGKYKESLEKGKEIVANLNGEKFPKVNKIFAYNYDRLHDSLKAIEYMEKYMNEEEPERINGDDYTMMAATYLKVPGNAVKAEMAAEKAIAADTSKEAQVDIMNRLATAYADQQDFKGQSKWLERKYAVKPDNSAREYFFRADAAFKAQEYVLAQNISSEYIQKYPDQPQGYIFKSKSAIAADPDTSKGTAIAAVDEYIKYLMQDTTKNKARIIQNHGYKVYYYLVKAQDYQKALESANDILKIDPANNYGQMAASEAQRLIKATGGKGANSSGQTGNPAQRVGVAATQGSSKPAGIQ